MSGCCPAGQSRSGWPRTREKARRGRQPTSSAPRKSVNLFRTEYPSDHSVASEIRLHQIGFSLSRLRGEKAMAIAAARKAPESQFPLEATGEFPEPRTRILKHGDTFAVLSRFGDMAGGAGCPDGLYQQDTRFLSQLELRINGDQPLLLSSSPAEDNSLVPVD